MYFSFILESKKKQIKKIKEKPYRNYQLRLIFLRKNKEIKLKKKN